MKIAIIGSGIAGNVVAHRLHRRHEIVVYEAGDRPGGHSHTHHIEHAGRHYDIDSGFIVYNEDNYPEFTRLLAGLGVATQPSRMSFSVRNERIGLEYCGTNANTIFAQRRNLVNAQFWRTLLEIRRFNARAPALLAAGAREIALGDYLRAEGYSAVFTDHYIVPMGAAIWSTRPGLMLKFPAQFFIRFLQNHGMLSMGKPLAWRSIVGGSQRYVEKLVAPFRDRIRLRTPVERVRRTPAGLFVHARGHEPERFDRVFMACHSDQALALYADPTPLEQQVLGAIPYQPNIAVLHTDASLLPTCRRAWAAWNYHVMSDREGPVCLTYDMNVLQNLDAPVRFLVTLNRADAIDPRRVLAEVRYEHPLFSPASTQAQALHRQLDGQHGIYYCGAWWRNGFHEDGVASALSAVAHFEQDDEQRALYRAG
ncbi:MAG TPA: FAD-dependent oxidoreductase [Steroidobacteraceae bacterium]|nr:FAD-dependent oxidoreductase [Steroidobacteraceae bacterium]